LDNEEKKKFKADLKQIEEKIQNKIKAKIKTEFNYQIPIAEVQKAGISTTGAKIENELETLAIEFKKYREKNKLWDSIIKEVQYQYLDENIGRVRIVDGVASESEIFYKITKE
jgi:type I restriction enzyme M protein